MSDTKYYCVGFYWWGSNPENQLPRFLKEGIWANGFDDKYLTKVKSIPVGSKLAAKTTYTRKVNGKNTSVLEVHCIGTVTDNPQDGRILKVNWDKSFKPFTLDGRGAYRSTISQVNHPENIEYIFGNKGKEKDTQVLPAFREEDSYDEKQLNQILYGPPGSGKTYHTINKAISIIDRIKERVLDKYYPTRESLKERFDELLIDDWLNPFGQIGFVTFHQSFNYEDFIEGIKPTIDKDKINYEYASGIFKSMVDLATNNWLDVDKGDKTQLSFDEAFSKFKDTWEEDQEMLFKMKTAGKEFQIIGFTKSSILFKKSSGGTDHTLSIKTLRDFYYGRSDRKLSGVGIYYPGVLAKLLEYSQATIEEEKDEKNYVLIIDEINRGNVSQIFGELITLIEKDKRLGNKESLEVILPYSKEKFSVPPNLYIIGTMNTADRSVEALDTALRRRFSFIEMPSKPELVSPQQMIWQLWWDYERETWKSEPFFEKEQNLYRLLGAKQLLQLNDPAKDKIWDKMVNAKADSLIFDAYQFNELNLEVLLKKINDRIEKLLSSDYAIGHSYFMGICSLEDLMEVIYNKIIPLLQEYFYGDYGKIGLVLGKGFIRIKKASIDDKLFADFDYDSSDLKDRDVFEILDYRKSSSFEMELNGNLQQVSFTVAIDLLLNKNGETFG
ncbi:MAG: hypothetical protein JWQ79_2511 [Mucilaginibacter sp.]|nr:hypothetical protein [Mucilaginibacter sp.]